MQIPIQRPAILLKLLRLLKLILVHDVPAELHELVLEGLFVGGGYDSFDLLSLIYVQCLKCAAFHLALARVGAFIVAAVLAPAGRRDWYVDIKEPIHVLRVVLVRLGRQKYLGLVKILKGY